MSKTDRDPFFSPLTDAELDDLLFAPEVSADELIPSKRKSHTFHPAGWEKIASDDEGGC